MNRKINNVIIIVSMIVVGIAGMTMLNLVVNFHQWSALVVLSICALIEIILSSQIKTKPRRCKKCGAVIENE